MVAEIGGFCRLRIKGTVKIFTLRSKYGTKKKVCPGLHRAGPMERGEWEGTLLAGLLPLECPLALLRAHNKRSHPYCSQILNLFLIFKIFKLCVFVCMSLWMHVPVEVRGIESPGARVTGKNRDGAGIQGLCHSRWVPYPLNYTVGARTLAIRNHIWSVRTTGSLCR